MIEMLNRINSVFYINTLTGLWAFHEHLSKNVHTTGKFGLNKVPVQYTWPPIPNPEHTNKPPTQSWEHLHGQTEGLQHHQW